MNVLSPIRSLNEGRDGLIRSQLAKLGLSWLGQVSWNETTPILIKKSLARGEAALSATGANRKEIRSKVPDVLRLTGLSTKLHQYPDQLSGGEQQRVSIARAFVNRPLILLADEPTGNLDPATSVGIMRLLDRINRTGTTVVMATHDRGIVDTMRRRVIELDKGNIVRDQSRGVYE